MFPQLYFLKESFMPLVYKYGVSVKLLEGYEDMNGEKDGMLTLFLNFNAPGEEFGIETKDVIRHYWQLINIIDENPNSPTINLDKLKRTRVINKFY